jgi:hypothetical protein
MATLKGKEKQRVDDESEDAAIFKQGGHSYREFGD